MGGESRHCEHATYGARRRRSVRSRAGIGELADVRTAAQLVTAMRWRRRLSGLTFPELRRRAAAVGDDLSREAMVLDGAELPRVRTVAALVRACGGEAAEVAAWVVTCRRLTAQATGAPTPPRPAPPRRLPSWLADAPPPRCRYPRWSVRTLALGIASVMIFAVVGVLVLSVPLGERGADPVAVAPDDREAGDGGTGEDAASAALAPTPPGERVRASTPPRKRDKPARPAPRASAPPVDEPLHEVPPHEPSPHEPSPHEPSPDGPVTDDPYPGCSYDPVPSCGDEDRSAAP